MEFVVISCYYDSEVACHMGMDFYIDDNSDEALFEYAMSVGY